MHSPELSEHPVVERLRASEQELYDDTYFAEHYWREDLPGRSGNHGLSYNDPCHSARFDFLCETILKPQRVKRVLDAGCGPGYLLERALANGFDAVGVDTSSVAQRLFKRRTADQWHERFSVASLTKLPYADRAFEFTVCLDVLEHVIVFDICRAVRELCRVTAGSIVCSINMDNPYRFHPSILSRGSWTAAFESTDLVTYNDLETARLNNEIKKQYAEYEMFVFVTR